MIASKLLVGYLNCGGLGARNPLLRKRFPSPEILWQEVCPQYANKPDLHDVTWFFCWSFLNDDDGTPWTVWRDFFGNWLNPEFLHLEKIHPISLYDIFQMGWKCWNHQLEKVTKTTNDINNDFSQKYPAVRRWQNRPGWLPISDPAMTRSSFIIPAREFSDWRY